MSSTSTTTSVSSSREENFAHNSENANGISLCIPHVFPNISWRRVKQHMIEANLGFVERVDVIRVKDKDYKRAYVHFLKNGWNMSDPTARQALQHMKEVMMCSVTVMCCEHSHSPKYWCCTDTTRTLRTPLQNL